MGVLGQISFPTGGGDATSDSVDPSLGLLWSYDVPGPATTFGTVVVSSLTNDDDGRFSQLGASFGAGFPIASNLNGYVEYFGVFADEGAPSNNVNGGLLYLATMSSRPFRGNDSTAGLLLPRRTMSSSTFSRRGGLNDSAFRRLRPRRLALWDVRF